MGKYMRKSKTTGEIAIMEVSQSSLGVRTRAKTLALRKLGKSLSPSPTSSGSYLQLRNRRLQKPSIVSPGHESKRQRQSQKDVCAQSTRENPNSKVSSRLRVSSMDSGSVGSIWLGCVNDKDDEKAEESIKEMADRSEKIHDYEENNGNGDLGIEEASFGENVLDFEGKGRSTRETTPCSLIRDPDSIRTPGSSTRHTGSTETNRRAQSSSRRDIPTAQEMDQFFASAEEKQQRQFMEKYNFDPVQDKPLPGHYEWEKLNP